jgi:hypothetical protein
MVEWPSSSLSSKYEALNSNPSASKKKKKKKEKKVILTCSQVILMELFGDHTLRTTGLSRSFSKCGLGTRGTRSPRIC